MKPLYTLLFLALALSKAGTIQTLHIKVFIYELYR